MFSIIVVSLLFSSPFAPLLFSNQAPSCSKSWRRWTTKLCWWRFSCWRVRRTTLSVTCPRPAPPSPRPGPPPMPSTAPQSSRQLLTCSQVSVALHFCPSYLPLSNSQSPCLLMVTCFCRNHPCGRGEGLEDCLLLLLWGLRGLRLHWQPQSNHVTQIHAALQDCPQLVSDLANPCS